jgi:glycosyltransferase involved in cell wall biosynthesis
MHTLRETIRLFSPRHPGLPVKVVLTRHLLYPIKSKFLYRRVNGWIAPTKQILDTLAPLKPPIAEVIPNWVDVEKFAFKPHSPHKPLRLGLLGQIAPHKGHDDAIEALRLLGDGYHLVIAGKGEDSYVARTPAEVRQSSSFFSRFRFASGLFRNDRRPARAFVGGAFRTCDPRGHVVWRSRHCDGRRRPA